MNNILRGQQMARRFTHGSRRPDVVRLQKYVASDYPNAIAAGFVNCSFSEYEQRLAGVIAGFEQQGIAVETVTMTVADILATLLEHGIPNTPDGRALAIGLFRSDWLDKVTRCSHAIQLGSFGNGHLFEEDTV